MRCEASDREGLQSPPMPDRLNALRERLKAQQRALLLCRWPSMRECRPGAPFTRSLH
jgi:hypothetical protein